MFKVRTNVGSYDVSSRSIRVPYASLVFVNITAVLIEFGLVSEFGRVLKNENKKIESDGGK